MNCSSRDVEGIGESGRGQKAILDDGCGKLLSRICNFKKRDPLEDSEPALGCFRITETGLVQHQKGGNELEVVPATVPPIMGDLLMRS